MRRRPRSVRQIISGTRHLLLDFDGPICSIFAETPAPAVAEELRGTLRAAGVSFPADVEAEQDPLQVFSYAAGLSPQTADLAQRELTKLETRAAATAKPTEGAADLIATAATTGRTVIIVSNNSSYAILEYLAIHRIGPVAGVVGRDESDPELMKPSPYLVRAAVGILDAHPDECAFVGDSTSDMLAGRLAGVPVIGYANKPGKTELLTQTGADAVTTGLDEITTALRLAPRPHHGCRIEPHLDQGGAGPGARAGLSLDEARLAHAGPHRQAPEISQAHSLRDPVLHLAVFPALHVPLPAAASRAPAGAAARSNAA